MATQGQTVEAGSQYRAGMTNICWAVIKCTQRQHQGNFLAMSMRLIAIITMLLCVHHHVDVVAGMCANNVCVGARQRNRERKGNV